MLLTNNNNHVFVCGLTRSGKSYFIHKALLELKGAALYMNIQGEKVPRGYLAVRSKDIDTSGLIELLSRGYKVNLILDPMRGYKVTAGYILGALMESGVWSENKPIYVALDECHLLKAQSLEGAIMAATAGLKKGVRCIFISQRPAVVNKTLYTQSLEHYIFRLPVAEAGYMQNKGIDYSYCQAEWQKYGEYSYCFYNGYVLEGRRPVR